MTDAELTEIRDLLREIRDLLLPVAGAHEEAHHARQAAITARRREAVDELLSTDKRRRAWALADGTRTQQQIANEAGMAKGNASMFFKSLRDLGAITETGNPARTVDVE